MCGKILYQAIFSSQEALSLHSPKFSHTTENFLIYGSLMHAHLCTYSAGFYYSNSVWERDHTKVERIILSQLRLRMDGRTSHAKNTGGTADTMMTLFSLTPCCPLISSLLATSFVNQEFICYLYLFVMVNNTCITAH